MNKYQSTIGLEIHAALKTSTKMFCDSPNDHEEAHANQNVCPVCLGHPGTLPVPNKKAIESVIRVGLAFGGKIAGKTKFDRKNYFYPDLPKGYQISQYDQPLVSGGSLKLRNTRKEIRLRRIHLEEDAGRLVHSTSADNRGPDADQRGQEKLQRKSALSQRESASLVDFNRAGVPLMELVTEPDFTSGEEVVEFAKYFQTLLRYLGVSDADMEKGQMRVEANVSLAAEDGKMGTKVEVKNINSFKAVGDAIDYEIKRQSELLEKGEKIKHETRGWNETKKATVSQRSKEEEQEYRYFPEPDLPPLETNIFDLEELKNSLPELPHQKLDRFKKEFGLTDKQAGLLVEDKKLADFFEQAASELATRDELATAKIEKKPQDLLFNYLTSDLLGLVNESGTPFEEMRVNPERMAHLVDLIADGKIMSRQAKDILKKMFADGSDPEEILIKEGLGTVSDATELENVVKEIIKENPAAVADYKKGKEASVQFLIGKAMGKLKGKGNPGVLKELFLKNLKR